MIKTKISIGIFWLLLLPGCSHSFVHQNSSPPIANASDTQQQGQMLEISAVAQIAGETIELEVAETSEQQAMGLMFRDALPDNRGMLFPFESERRVSFWMKNVPVALDMIFIRGDRVIDIAVSVPPCLAELCPIYGPEAAVDKVIELRGGRTKELGLKTGDSIVIKPL